ncbi:hypothetical protein HanHA300_Chr16g0598261 [Helianthus annuus]|nr:hypothetical protein HanHA300_Chr16g0598261 [Helianthus annuus]KAJ0459416.1 hypothetical protein HanHA89_Chr16g0648731 [Helianthus annuus]KAJ0639945.1 hypothetical protein HanLR1_Chr16g0609561 [Helianthus annuus]KAJ0643899.1 hypothetical protein HanOQP8_Chr16g0605761 [Helianthus annuus]
MGGANDDRNISSGGGASLSDETLRLTLDKLDEDMGKEAGQTDRVRGKRT